jgi:serine/threonine-protein kinase RsbW
MHERDPEARMSAPLTSTPRRVQMRVPAVAGQVATVRHAVLESAKAHGIGRAPCDDIALSVSEACTNVVLHAYRGAPVAGLLAVDAYRNDGEFFVVVCDEGSGMSPRTDSPGVGLGLGLIGRLTQRVEITSNDPVGATITMVFAAPQPAPAEDTVENPAGTDARDEEIRMQKPADRTTTRALSSAEREWIRQQGRVSRALEAAQRRSTGRFSRVTKPPAAASPGTRTSRRAPA